MTQRWTPSMVKRVLERAQSDEELADEFATTAAAIRAVRFRQRPDARLRQAQYNAKYYSRIREEQGLIYQPWTLAEDRAIMAKNCPSVKALSEQLPGRSPCAIRCRRWRLNSQRS